MILLNTGATGSQEIKEAAKVLHDAMVAAEWAATRPEFRATRLALRELRRVVDERIWPTTEGAR